MSPKQSPLFHAGQAQIDSLNPAQAFDAWTDRSLLDSMQGGGIDWPSSCRNGSCRTCLAQLEAGAVRHRVDWPSLSPEELAAGAILPCVALPLGPVRLRFEGFL